MAKSSKSRRGQSKEAGEPDTQPDAGRQEQPGEPDAEAVEAGHGHVPETEKPSEEGAPAAGEAEARRELPLEEATASPEAPVYGEDHRIDEAAAAHDEPTADTPHEPDVQPDEPETAETEPQPGPGRIEPAPERGGSRAWLAIGLIVALAVIAGAGAWFYASYGAGWVAAGRLDTMSQRLDGVSQRLNEVASEAEAQADRLAATEQAMESLRADTGQFADRLDGVASVLDDVRAVAEANRQRLDEVTQTVEELRLAGPDDGSGAAQVVGELRTTIEALAGRVQELEQAQGQGQDLSQFTQTIEGLEQEIDELRSQAEARAEQAQLAGALGQAYAMLAQRVAAGEPFAEALQTMAGHVPGAPGLDALRPLADEGVATVSDLRARLAEAAAGLTGNAEEAGDTGAGSELWAGIRERLEGAVTIRRANEADWPAVIARADAALQAGNVGVAVSEIEQASSDPPPELDAWLAEAERRRDANAALDDLSAVVLRQLAGQG